MVEPLSQGKYEVTQKGPGCFLRAEEAAGGRRVSLWPLNGAGAEALANAVSVLSAGGCEFILAPREVISEAGHDWLVLDAFPRKSLRELLDRAHKHCLEPRELARIAADLCEALDYLHGKGLAHGAVTPEHVGVTDEGSARLAWVGPSAASPQDDLQQLAALIYEMATGKSMSPGQNTPIGSPKELNYDLSDDLSALIVRLLSPDAARRPLSARDMLIELTELALFPACGRGLGCNSCRFCTM